MRRILFRSTQQRGQMLVMFAAMFAVITVVGFLVVDTGLWLAERRGAQTDADLPALAGARECMLQLATGQTHDPYPAIVQWFDENNSTNNPDVQLVADKTSTSCFDPSDGGPCGPGSPYCCVDVVVKHKSRTLFSNLPFFNHAFDDVAGNIGAHARACAGAANNPGSIVPFEIESVGPCYIAGKPDFGTMCELEGSSHSSNPRGMLDLQAAADYCSDSGGSGSIEDTIENGASGLCLINEDEPCDPGHGGPWYNCVATQTGNGQKVLNGTEARIAREGMCDRNGNGRDDLDEVVKLVVDSSDPSKRVYEAVDCDPNTDGIQVSPRLITVILLNQVPSPGNSGYPITGFAGFYLDGCGPDDLTDPSQLSNDEKKCHVGNPGQQVVYGTFVSVTVAGSGIGPSNGTATEFGVALCDWESGGCGGTAPTPVPWPTSTPSGPTATPGGSTDTPAPTPTTWVPTPCATVCDKHGKNCHEECPTATNTPRPPTPTRTPVPTATPTRPPTATPLPTNTNTPCPCGTKPNGTCRNC
jgi:hypothetical protein